MKNKWKKYIERMKKSVTKTYDENPYHKIINKKHIIHSSYKGQKYKGD